MAYTDPYGDAGMYTGEVDDESRPHGKGKMKYNNGIFYEGNWIHGCKDDVRGQKGNTKESLWNRERILGGFTSWKGKGQKDGSGNKGFVYGMEWVDHAGLNGKYTGPVDVNNVPHTPDGKGVMKYSFGLVAEGEWKNGVLNYGSGSPGGMNPAQVAAASGMSVAPGMSVAGGSASGVSGLGMASIGGTPQMMMNPYQQPLTPPTPPATMFAYNPAGVRGNTTNYPSANPNPSVFE